eukprot:1159151-Pelagomonas_calceolata.AAC.2
MPDPYKRYAPEVHAQRPNLASPFSCAAWRAEVRSLLSARAVREASTKLLARWRAAASARLDAVSCMSSARDKGSRTLTAQSCFSTLGCGELHEM